MSVYTREDVFGMYTKLAARVTNLRAILQNDIPLSLQDAVTWTEDYKSVMSDLMQLGELTAAQIRILMEKESTSCQDTTSPK
jgi:hypothetical protein